MNDSQFLIYVAQNDYMIDNHYLPTGERLVAIACHMNGEGTVEGCPCCFDDTFWTRHNASPY